MWRTLCGVYVRVLMLWSGVTLPQKITEQQVVVTGYTKSTVCVTNF